ncbi:hypothetical protein PWT90_10835 [Aphanocladium album]|nr:hypothetical protein PWT90_10835 [Aphanocladium album]
MLPRRPLTTLGLAAVVRVASADTHPAPTVTSSHTVRPDAVIAASSSIVTEAPATDILQGRGYVRPDLVGYRSYDGYYWDAINCPAGSVWATHSGYGACCPYGAETCSNYATSCAGNRVVFWGERTGSDCGSSICDTLTVYSNLDGTTRATATMTDVLCFAMILSDLDPRTAYKQTFNLKPTSTSTSTHASQTTTTTTRKPNAGSRVQSPGVTALIGAIGAAVLL